MLLNLSQALRYISRDSECVIVLILTNLTDDSVGKKVPQVLHTTGLEVLRVVICF